MANWVKVNYQFLADRLHNISVAFESRPAHLDENNVGKSVLDASVGKAQGPAYSVAPSYEHGKPRTRRGCAGTDGRGSKITRVKYAQTRPRKSRGFLDCQTKLLPIERSSDHGPSESNP